jgi:hypothetical protein
MEPPSAVHPASKPVARQAISKWAARKAPHFDKLSANGVMEIKVFRSW